MPKWVVITIIIVVIGLVLWLVVPLDSHIAERIAATPNEYVGDDQCKRCHTEEYHQWKESDHYKAMLPASDSSIVGDFNNVEFVADGVRSRFFKIGSEFFINTQGPDGKNRDYKVKYSFGHYPLQQYLVEFPGGRMQVPRVSWDSKDKKWFHQYAGQAIHPADWLHWGRDAQNWNTMCATCHSTNLQKNYSTEADSFHTTYSSMNVSCESCHGAGKHHIDFINAGEYKKGDSLRGSFIYSTRHQLMQVNSCAPCHARKTDIGSELYKDGDLLDYHIPAIPTNEHFYADGQVKDEDYIYTSFMQSKMAHRGVKCSDCHNPHTGKVLFQSNQLCLQCHGDNYNSAAHHFHQVNSTGSDCKSCHMPGTVYMGNDLRHDHSFRIPRPDQTVKYGVPNACNNCHSDKSATWAAAAVMKHFGNERKYHFSDDLVPGSLLNEGSEAHLLKLSRDTSTPAIIKATALSYLGSIFSRASFEAMQAALNDSNAIVRYHALRSLSNFPSNTWVQIVAPLLSDKVRAVRIAAADLYAGLPASQMPQNYLTAYRMAFTELRNYVHYQADFAEGNVLIADHYLKLQEYPQAEKFYLRGLKKDSLLNYARLNLSATFSAQGKNQEALSILKQAALVAPKNERVWFNLGLLNVELKDTLQAMRNFETAVKLKSNNPRLYYNYGLLLFQAGNTKKAIEVLQTGVKLNPMDADLNYAIAYVYLQLGKKAEARPYVIALKNIDPVNPDYLELFNVFNL